MNKQLNQYDIEKQEHLSLGKLKLLAQAENSAISRPMNSILDVMNWSFEKFSNKLKDNKNINRFLYNIPINGQFIYYCQKNNISIDVLYKESVISNQTINGFENFSIQGVFLIKYNNFEYILSSLSYKSHQYNDEICNFSLVSENNYDSYIKFRNDFLNWSIDRDRENSFIQVINGNNIPYNKSYKWSDIFLPTDLKNNIKKSIEEFLTSKDFYTKNNIPWKRGILFAGQPGVGKTTLIKTIISNYDFKPVTIHSNVNDSIVYEAFTYAEQNSPSLLYFEDLDALINSNTIDLSLFLNLMDGICAKNGMLVIATANDLNNLQSNIIDRPSRFDRKYTIPLPDQTMISDYLNQKFGILLNKEKRAILSKIAFENNFSYAYLKDLYISSFSKAILNNRKKPNMKDIDISMDVLMKNKINLNDGINLNKYFV